MLQITNIEANDFKILYNIEVQAYEIPWSYTTLSHNQGENYINLKIMLQQQIVGFVICHQVLDEATIYNLAISPNFQKQGLAAKLLTELISCLQGKGVNTIWLEVRETNLIAQKLYDKFGFTQVCIRKNYYPIINSQEREHAIIMALYLNYT